MEENFKFHPLGTINVLLKPHANISNSYFSLDQNGAIHKAPLLSLWNNKLSLHPIHTVGMRKSTLLRRERHLITLLQGSPECLPLLMSHHSASCYLSWTATYLSLIMGVSDMI